MPFRARNVGVGLYTTDSVGNPYTVGAKYKFKIPYDTLLPSDIFGNSKGRSIPFIPIPENTPCTIIEASEAKISFIDCSFYLGSEVYTLFMFDPNAFLIPDTAGGRRRRRRASTRRTRRMRTRRRS
jgi:hypothetical protein